MRTVPKSVSSGLTRHRWLLGLALLLALAAAAFFTDLQELLRTVLNWVQGLGMIGVVAFALLYTLTVVLLIPATFLTLGAGAIFGAFLALPVVWFSATAGATLSFLLGRGMARDWVERRLAANPRLARLDAAVGESGWRIVFLARLSPLFPFTLLNYAFGATQIPPGQYVIATATGLLPGILLYVWIGDTLGSLAGLRASHAFHGPWRWVFYGAALASAAAVTWYVARLARRTLHHEVD